MPTFRFSTEGSQAVAAAQDRINRGLKDQQDATERITYSTAELGRISKQVQRETETGQERLNRLLREANEARKNNTLTDEAYHRQVQKLNKEFDTSTGKFKDMADAQDKTFGGAAVAKLAAFGAGLLSIQKLMQLITSEMQAQSDLRERQAQARAGVEGSREFLSTALGGTVGAGDIGQIRGDIQEIGRTAGVEEQILNRAFVAALSSAGGNRQTALSALRVAAEQKKASPAEIEEQAAALAAIGLVTRNDDAYANAAFLAQIATPSGLRDPRAQAKTIPQALTAGATAGLSAATSGRIFAAVSGEALEARGEITVGGIQSFAEKLNAFNFGLEDAAATLSKTEEAERKAFEKIRPGTGVDFQRGQREADYVSARQRRISAAGEFDRRSQLLEVFSAMSGDEKLGFLQSNPDIAEEFFGTGEGFEKKVKIQFGQLIRGVGPAAEAFRALEGQIVGGTEAGGRALIERAERTDPAYVAGQTERLIRAGMEQLRTTDPRQFVGRETIDELQQLLMASRMSGLASGLQRQIEDFGGVFPEDARRIANQAGQRLLGAGLEPSIMTRILTGLGLAPGAGGLKLQASEEDKRIAERMLQIGESIEDILKTNGGFIASGE